MSREWKLGEVCQHQRLGRQCPECELLDELAEVKQELEEAREELRVANSRFAKDRHEAWTERDSLREKLALEEQTARNAQGDAIRLSCLLVECEEKLAAAETALREATEWRPMETAPRDGLSVLLLDNRDLVWLGWWNDYRECWSTCANCDADRGQEMRGWLPPPAPPKEAP